jgi:protein-S-isoprenylcysteine O-methyltransferase Ste14
MLRCGASITSAPSRGLAPIASGPLVSSGPFARVRNPLYLGNIAIWIGFALTARLVWLAPVI